MNIDIFTAGGTIDKIYFDALSEYQVGESNTSILLREMNVGFKYRVKSLFRKDSLDLNEEDRALIRKEVEKSKKDKILITHGTDTMIETAKTLKKIKGKTIVLTGSLKPSLFKDSDAIFNIGFALGCLLNLKKGVYIAMNGTVFKPDNVIKDRKLEKFVLKSESG